MVAGVAGHRGRSRCIETTSTPTATTGDERQSALTDLAAVEIENENGRIVGCRVAAPPALRPKYFEYKVHADRERR
jgi:hypothetical protein